MQDDKVELTLDGLNDDCLDCIFRRVHELPAQIQIAQVCRRFRDIYARMWHSNRSYHTLCLESLREELPHYEDLLFFMQTMRTSFTTIKIIDECLSAFLKDLEDLGISLLPNVHYFDLLEFTDCYPSDEDIKTLAKLLPNLRCLRLTTPISGRFIVNFKFLEELHLYDDQDKEFEIKQEHLQDICTNLKQLRVLDIRSYEISNLQLTPYIAQCENLETLKLNLNVLKPALHDILKLPRLKSLTVLLDNVIDVSRIVNVDTHDYKIYETVEFYDIIKMCSERIVGIAIDNYYMPLSMDWDANLQLIDYGKLHKFAFCNSKLTAVNAMLAKYTKMSQLNLLSCRNMTKLTNDTLLEFIEMCPQLMHLDVSYCKRLDKALLHGALSILKQQKRRKPLHIYYLLSGLESEVEYQNPKYWRTQDLIKLSTDFPPNSDPGLSFVDRGFEFDFE